MLPSIPGGEIMQRIGFIGLGLMGQPMSRRLLEAGHPLTAWNRTAEKSKALLAAGAAWADSPGAVARASDVVITMVTDSAASEGVICRRSEERRVGKECRSR